MGQVVSKGFGCSADTYRHTLTHTRTHTHADTHTHMHTHTHTGQGRGPDLVRRTGAANVPFYSDKSLAKLYSEHTHTHTHTHTRTHMHTLSQTQHQDSDLAHMTGANTDIRPDKLQSFIYVGCFRAHKASGLLEEEKAEG